MEELTLEDGARSFYSFLNSVANLIPAIFCLMCLAMCIYTGHNIYKMVQNEGANVGDQSMTGQVIGFCLAALLGITTIITYAFSRVWMGLWT